MTAASTSPTDTRDTSAQIERLIELGVAGLAGITNDELRALGSQLPPDAGGTVIIHDSLVAPSRLAPLLEREGRPGFIVGDMVDLDAFTPIDGLRVPRIRST